MSSTISSSSVSSHHETRSLFHKNTQNFLISYLNQQFGYDEELSSLVIYIHKCSDLSQTMNLFILNDDNKYEHVFIPNEDEICRLCGEGIKFHTFEYGKNEKELIEIAKELYHKEKMEEDLDDEEQLVFERKKLIKKLSKTQNLNCEICYMSKRKSEMVYIADELHPICNSCMNYYLREQILNLRIQRIGCPHCGQLLTAEVIKQFVNNVTFEKYETFLRNLEIQKNPNLRWCPNPKCSIVINCKKGKSTITCPKCSTSICAKCNRQAHPKQSCDAVLQHQFRDLQNAKDIQKCRKCKALVEKISGCNHMTCTVCYYQWCWLCGSTYSDYHFSPLNPLGCAGLQDTHHNNWGKCKIIALRILIFIGFLVLVPIVLPICMVGCGPFLSITYCWREKRVDRKNCWYKIAFLILLIPIGLIVDPFIWIAAICWAIPQFFKLICEWIEQRREIHKYSEDNIKQKLLMEGQILSEDMH